MNKKIVIIFTTLLLFLSPSILTMFNPQNTYVEAFQKTELTTAYVISDLVNVRQGPSLSSKVICQLQKGTAVILLGKLPGWYAIYEPSKKCVGVISSQFLKTSSMPSTTGKSTVVATVKPKVTTVVPTPKPIVPFVSKPTSTPIADVTQEEQQLLALINKARSDAGVRALQFDMPLVKISRLKAIDMVDKKYFSHQSPTYGSPFDMMRQFGITFKTAGENIAGNQNNQAAFDAWMNSEGHKKNILNANFNFTGLGIQSSPVYGKIFVQQFIGK